MVGLMVGWASDRQTGFRDLCSVSRAKAMLGRTGEEAHLYELLSCRWAFRACSQGRSTDAPSSFGQILRRR
ncbi:hypothetical protein EGJ08_07465 [Stutzerimonas stutzeri]|nr:hypothetical protein AYK87_14970 [Stutzerimonas stutzeri]RRV60475.1 hypothetical protein EGJ08_07465 [Stutzerimonas stutzeri]RRV77038.1 hypothetical protein EGJ18_01455 [Stutzerimonas stutzeri]TFZ19795.1 hypothetical protein AK6_13765 [Stutzerimonas stutzeri]